jgi:hypothetical protein
MRASIRFIRDKPIGMRVPNRYRMVLVLDTIRYLLDSARIGVRLELSFEGVDVVLRPRAV